jgi:hypothetical protein
MSRQLLLNGLNPFELLAENDEACLIETLLKKLFFRAETSAFTKTEVSVRQRTQ